MLCLICNNEFKSYKSLSIHLRCKHKNISSKNYYDTYIKKEYEGICYCGKNTQFLNISKGYCIHCSTRCSSLNKEVNAKRKRTYFEKYKGKYYEQRKKKIKLTWLSKSDKEIENINQKRKATYLEKYGVVNPNKIEDIRKKIKNTCLEKYGVECNFMHKSTKDKIKQTCLKKYGVENPSQNSQIKEKRKETFISRYKGYPGQNKEIKNLIRNTRIKNFLPKLIKCLNINNFELIDNYNNNRENIEFLCRVCNTKFTSTYFNIKQNGQKCPTCYPKSFSSAEIDIFNYMKTFKFAVNSTKNIIPPLELDIYIPSDKIAIEYNGLYWHSEKIGRDKNYHLNKLKACNYKNIQLIQIFEDEWLFKQDIVKSRLKQILNINNSKRIHARSCNIKEIVPNIKNLFLEKYHLQGKDNSNIKLGAFYNEELVAVMTFSHGNIAKGSYAKERVWELNRFCINYDYRIPGIASKLLTYFKRNYEWKEIFSYADRRWSQGNLYYKLGFELEKETQPNYWYVKGSKRIHRFNLRKRSDEPKNISESILRIKEGYIKIWDCGHLKFKIRSI